MTRALLILAAAVALAALRLHRDARPVPDVPSPEPLETEEEGLYVPMAADAFQLEQWSLFGGGTTTIPPLAPMWSSTTTTKRRH